MKKKLLVFICISIFISINCGKDQEDDYSTIIFYIGDVKKNHSDIQIGEKLLENDLITTGTQSLCDIKIGESLIRVKEKSSVKLSEITNKNDIEKTILDMDIGKILCKAKKLKKSERFMVKTPTAVAGVRGTKFTVEADSKKTTRIKVFNGKVKVLKRVKLLEDKIDKIIEAAPEITNEEKVVVTAEEVKKTEKIVEDVLKIEKKSGEKIEVVLIKVIDSVKDNVIVTKKEIQKFNIEDFKDEKKEIIEVQQKPKEVIKQIKQIVKLEQKEPVPEGRLLITRYEIHFIKNGKPVWEGKIINSPVQKDNKLYIASGNYVFCASVDGPVFWKRKIENDGKVELKDNKLIVFAQGKQVELDIVTGK